MPPSQTTLCKSGAQAAEVAGGEGAVGTAVSSMQYRGHGCQHKAAPRHEPHGVAVRQRQAVGHHQMRVWEGAHSFLHVGSEGGNQKSPGALAEVALAKAALCPCPLHTAGSAQESTVSILWANKAIQATPTASATVQAPSVVDPPELTLKPS